MPGKLKARPPLILVENERSVLLASSSHLGNSHAAHRSPDSVWPNSGPVRPVPKTTTFPLHTALQASGAACSLHKSRSRSINKPDPIPRPSLHELGSPPELSVTGASGSNGTPSSLNQSQYVWSNQSIATNPVPNLSATFPSTDPFTYPNQPMMDFGSAKQEDQGTIGNLSQVPAVFSSYGPGSSDDLEANFFDPIPPGLATQWHQVFDWQAHQAGSGTKSGFNQQAPVSYPSVAMDEIFSGEGEDWSDIGASRRYWQGNGL